MSRALDIECFAARNILRIKAIVKCDSEGVEKVREEIAILREGQELVDLAQEA